MLALLATAAVIVTGVLGYVRARDALEKAVFDHLTNVRKSKARQVETYFQKINAELRLLAGSKMVMDATRDFKTEFTQIDSGDAPPELRQAVADWYAAAVLPNIARLYDSEVSLASYLPAGPAAYHLQSQYIVGNPNRDDRRSLLDDAGDGSGYSKHHSIYHPLMRAAAATVGFSDLLIADPKSGRVIYTVAKRIDFSTSLQTGPYKNSNLAAAVARCGVIADRSAVCLEDFTPYDPAAGAPIAFMAAPVVAEGVVIGVLVAQISNDEIDRVVTGDRKWAQEGFGATGEAYLVGLDGQLRSAPRAFYEQRSAYFADLRAVGVPEAEIETIDRFGTPVLHQRVDTVATRAALSGVEGIGQVVGYRGVPTLASWGPAAIPGLTWAVVAKIELSEAFAPIDRLRTDLLLVGSVTLLAVTLLAAWLSHLMLAPLRDLTAGVRRLALGDYGVNVSVKSRDEFGQLSSAFNGMVSELREKNLVIENKVRENEQLLLNVLPAPIANRLRGGEQRIADGFAEVTVAFADLVDFTALTSDMPPQEVVSFLNGLFTRFDAAALELGIEKIKTVGDAYMAVCGLPVPVENHAERMVRMAIRMVHITREHAMEHNISVRLRVGINSGPVVAGVIGKSRYIYDLWGDTVNLASRMESGSMPDAIQVTRSVYERLKDQFVFEARGIIDVKGKKDVEAWLLRL